MGTRMLTFSRGPPPLFTAHEAEVDRGRAGGKEGGQRAGGALGELKWPRLVPNDLIKCTFSPDEVDDDDDHDGVDAHDQSSPSTHTATVPLYAAGNSPLQYLLHRC